MKRLLFLTILVAFSACKEISFKEPQPLGKKTHKTIPRKMWGRYVLSNEDGSVKDTLFVKSDGYSVGSDHKNDFLLGDSLVLKSYDGYYFLNINNDPQWSLRILQSDKNGDLIYMTLEQENTSFPEYLKNLSGQIQIDSSQTDKGKLYQIDPTPKQLVSLIKKGYVKKVVLNKVH